MSRIIKKALCVLGAAVLIGGCVGVCVGSKGLRNWDFKSWFNYWGKGNPVVNPVDPIPDTPPLHIHTEVTDIGKAPTCTETGLTDGKHCSECNEVITGQTVIAATGHTEVTDIGKAPTCTETGLTDGKHCSECNVVTVEREVMSTIPHDYIYGICSECGQENLNPVFDSTAFYLVGTMNNWVWSSDKYKFIEVDSNVPNVTSQYKLTITLTEGTEFKVWNGNWTGNGSYIDSFESVDYIVWTDNGLGGQNPALTETGTYNFYLKFFNDGGCSIYVEKLTNN